MQVRQTNKCLDTYLGTVGSKKLPKPVGESKTLFRTGLRGGRVDSASAPLDIVNNRAQYTLLIAFAITEGTCTACTSQEDAESKYVYKAKPF